MTGNVKKKDKIKFISLTRLSKENYYQSFFDLNIRNVRNLGKQLTS